MSLGDRCLEQGVGIALRELTAREKAAVLAALRLWQRELKRGHVAMESIATDDGSHEALSAGEVDGLCEKLNLAAVREVASEAELSAARDQHGTCEIQVDDGAAVCRGDGVSWVQAWLLIPDS